jgi:hypothetical protein
MFTTYSFSNLEKALVKFVCIKLHFLSVMPSGTACFVFLTDSAYLDKHDTKVCSVTQSYTFSVATILQMYFAYPQFFPETCITYVLCSISVDNYMRSYWYNA